MTHPPGTFCTALLHTRDVASASRFYSAVFGPLCGLKREFRTRCVRPHSGPRRAKRGKRRWQPGKGLREDIKGQSPLAGWETLDDDRAPGFTLRGQRVAGIRRTRDDANLWVPYVAVDNVDVARDAAASSGGTVIESALVSHRQLTVIKDPEGAVFGLCAADATEVVTLTEGPGTIWWVEVLANVPAALMRFYSGLLQWRFTEQPLDPHPVYVTWMLGDRQVGGLLPIGPGWNTPPRWQVLFQVDDLEAASSRVVAAGGQVEFGPLEVPRAGTLTSVRDPSGALHVLVQPRRVAP